MTSSERALVTSCEKEEERERKILREGNEREREWKKN